MAQLKPSLVDTSRYFILNGSEYEKGGWTLIYNGALYDSSGDITNISDVNIGIAYKSDLKRLLVSPIKYYEYTDVTDTPYASYSALLTAMATLLNLGAASEQFPGGVSGDVQVNVGGVFTGSTNFSYLSNSLNIGGASNASAILDVTSTTKGVLIPRMDSTARNAIASPATGLEIYNTTTLRPEYYNGTAWVATGAAAAAGSTTQIQYNDAGVLGASNLFTWDNTNKTLGLSPATTVSTGNPVKHTIGPVVASSLLPGQLFIERASTGSFFGVLNGTTRTGFNIAGRAAGATFGEVLPNTDISMKVGNAAFRLGSIVTLQIDTNSVGSILSGAALQVISGATSNIDFYPGNVGLKASFTANGQFLLGTATADDSAILKIDSTTKGVLIPRMDTTARNAIATPANSLLIYNTDNKRYEYYNLAATTWFGIAETVETTLTPGANIAWALGSNKNTKVVLDQNSTLDNPTEKQAGTTHTIKIAQGGAGSYTIAFGTDYVTAANSTVAYTLTLPNGVGDFAVVQFYCDGTKMIAL